jgi:hypothetical protein
MPDEEILRRLLATEVLHYTSEDMRAYAKALVRDPSTPPPKLRQMSPSQLRSIRKAAGGA